MADYLPPHPGNGGFDTWGLGDGWEGYYARSAEILLEGETQNCATYGGCDGVIPPESIIGACPRVSPPDTPPVPHPGSATDPSSTQTCTGTDVEACMYASPGVWVGSRPMPSTGGLTRHTATATVDNFGIFITELYVDGSVFPPVNKIFHAKGTPYNANMGDFTWARVAGPAWIFSARNAALRATWEYADQWYLGSSGRFTSAILRGAGIILSPSQRTHLGNSPGLCWCLSCEWSYLP